MRSPTEDLTIHSSEVDREVRPARIAIVVVSTHHGNTRKVAEAIAATLGADLLSVDQVGTHSLQEYDLVGFGSGIYFGCHDRSLRRVVKSMQHVPSASFVFSTAGLPWLSKLFHWALRKSLTQRGSQILGEFCCRGWDTVGPLFLMGGINRRHPDERDLKRATKFATQLAVRTSKRD